MRKICCVALATNASAVLVQDASLQDADTNPLLDIKFKVDSRSPDPIVSLDVGGESDTKDLDANVDPPRSRPVRPSELERLMNLPANSTDGVSKVPGERNQDRQLRRRTVANDAVHGSIVGFAVRASGILSLRESSVAQPPLHGVGS